MQPVTEEELTQIIKEAKQAGKDVSKLEASLEKMSTKAISSSPLAGQKIERSEAQGTVVIESTGPAREDDFKGKMEGSGSTTSSDLSKEPELTVIAKEEDAAKLFGGAGSGLKELSGTGYAWGRIDCGNSYGTIRVRIGCWAVTPSSAVFVSASEGHYGDAWYTIHNVVPMSGEVLIRLTVNWNYPLRLYFSLLVINP